MTVKNKYRYVIYLLVSLAIHGALIVFIEPTIEKKGTPVFTSWLDILSEKDLVYTSLKNKGFSKQLSFYFLENNHSSSYFSRDRMLFFLEKRQIFKRESQPRAKKDKIVSFVLKKKQAPLLDLLNVKYKNLSYRVAITPRGRVIFVSPRILPLNSSSTLYLDKYLRESLLFLEEDRFRWTYVKVVIE